MKKGQKTALLMLCDHYTKSKPERLYLLSKLLDRRIESMDDLNVSDWEKIRDEAYPDWTENKWEISIDFSSRCRTAMSRYDVDELGQLTLF